MNYEHLLYKRGYLFSQAKIEPPILTWTSKTVGDYYICFDPENQWGFARKDDIGVALLGRAIDILNWTSNINSIARNCLDRLILSEEKLLDYIDYLSGRFILIYHHGGTTKFMTDAFGTRSAFYSLQQPVMIASHCRIISDYLKSSQSTQMAAIRQDDRWRTGSNYGYPGNLTPYEGIYILTPNTLINIEQRKIQRFYPRKELPSGNLADVVEEVSAAMKRQLELLHKENKLAISLSAGIDTRTTLAAARDIARDVLFFTYGPVPALAPVTDTSPTAGTKSAQTAARINSNIWQARENDLLVASDMAQALELRHIPLNDTVSRDDFQRFNQVLDRNTYHSHGRGVAKAYLDKLPPGILHIRSNLGEIGRAFYRKRGFNKLPLAAETMARVWKVYKGVWNNEPVVAAFRQFARTTDFTDIMNYDPYDMFYWEHRMGAWHSLLLLEGDVAFDTHIPFDCRALAERMLSVPVDDRIEEAVHLGIIRHLWPVLLVWPINQPPFSLQLENIQAKLKDKQKALNAELVSAGKQVEQLKAERETLSTKLGSTSQRLARGQRQLNTIKKSTAFQSGYMQIQAIRKPGRNTVLLPYRLCRLFVKALRKKAPAAIPAKQSQKPSRLVKPEAPGKPDIHPVENAMAGKLRAEEFVVADPATLPYEETDGAKKFWESFGVYRTPAPWSNFIAEEVLRFSPASVFEFGCYNCRNLVVIRDRAPGITFHGIDINPEAVAASQKAGFENVQLGDENVLHSFSDGAFDVCFTSSVLDHMPRPLHALTELLRISRKACLFFEPFLGKEGKVLRNYNLRQAKTIDTTPFSYSWDYIRMLEAVNTYVFQGNLIIRVIDHPVDTNLGRYYRLYIVQRRIPAAADKPPSSVSARRDTVPPKPAKRDMPGKPGISSTENIAKVSYKEVKLEDIVLSQHTAMIREKYIERYGVNVARRQFGRYTENDWKRIEYISSLLPDSASILDIGIGNRAFINLLLSLNRFQRVLGIEKRGNYIRSHYKSTALFDRHLYELIQGSVTNLPLRNRCIDVVTCMEVLEHLDRDSFLAALPELRRVGKFLLLTVPYNEPEPLPSYHKLRFTDKELLTYFPDAEFILLRKVKYGSWMIILEHP